LSWKGNCLIMFGDDDDVWLCLENTLDDYDDYDDDDDDDDSCSKPRFCMLMLRLATSLKWWCMGVWIGVVGSAEFFQVYPLVNKKNYWTWPFILDLPVKNGDFP
jgi:hypothetical protein